MIVKLKGSETIICRDCEVADNFMTRLKGLMFAQNMGQRDGLILDPCNSIHTFFMQFEIDVLFLNQSNQAIKIIRSMKPWRMTMLIFKAKRVLEMAGGQLPSNINLGDEIEVICTN